MARDWPVCHVLSGGYAPIDAVLRGGCGVDPIRLIASLEDRLSTWQGVTNMNISTPFGAASTPRDGPNSMNKSQEKEAVDDNTSRWVYLVGSTLTKPVKIGVAKNAEARLDELRVGSPVPLHIIWKARGGRALESSLHEYFAPYRIHGEWFDFGDENPAALVATAAVLMGNLSHPLRVTTEARLRIVHSVLADETPNTVGHLINAASATGRGSVTNAEAFAYLATVDPEFARGTEEGDEQYRSRVGKRLATALRAEGVAVRLTKVTTANGTRSAGYRLEALKSALSARFERRQPARSTWPMTSRY